MRKVMAVVLAGIAAVSADLQASLGSDRTAKLITTPL